MDLVKYRKEGKIVYYSLKSNILKHLFMENLKYVKEES
jgi:DNA-binding transcriptional ArsR family regulator